MKIKQNKYDEKSGVELMKQCGFSQNEINFTNNFLKNGGNINNLICNFGDFLEILTEHGIRDAVTGGATGAIIAAMSTPRHKRKKAIKRAILSGAIGGAVGGAAAPKVISGGGRWLLGVSPAAAATGGLASYLAEKFDEGFDEEYDEDYNGGLRVSTTHPLNGLGLRKSMVD